MAMLDLKKTTLLVSTSNIYMEYSSKFSKKCHLLTTIQYINVCLCMFIKVVITRTTKMAKMTNS